jgi:hypothetical protein
VKRAVGDPTRDETDHSGAQAGKHAEMKAAFEFVHGMSWRTQCIGARCTREG